MKETQIAKENVEALKRMYFEDSINRWKDISKTHLKSCQRFLEFCKGFGEKFKEEYDKANYINYKIKDLKEAIKVYEDGV